MEEFASEDTPWPTDKEWEGPSKFARGSAMRDRLEHYKSYRMYPQVRIHRSHDITCRRGGGEVKGRGIAREPRVRED